jgi:hypothetical protein
MLLIIQWILTYNVDSAAAANLEKTETVMERGVLLRFKRLLNDHLDSPQSKFQISNKHLPYRKLEIFFSINTFMSALNQGAHTSFF